MDYTKDNRNVIDEFKGWEHNDIVAELDKRGVALEIAIENSLRDYNMGTIVRTANAFGVRTVHVIGRKQWNKRGAMATDKYLRVVYHKTVEDFCLAVDGKALIAIDNIPSSVPLSKTDLPKNTVMIFGQEGPGISDELLKVASAVVAIEQLGSTRSINVGVAAGIAMYTYLHRHSI